MNITARTRVFALFGDPVEHSASPEIQNAAFIEAGVDGVYIAVRCATEDLAGFMRGLALAGGGGNITLPHKEKAAAIVDVSSEAVRRTGACNTFWGQDGKVHGDNTDVEGFRRALRIFVDGPSQGIRALVLGAGGAARATLLGLLEEGAGEVLLYNRTSERAQAVARRIGGQRARGVPLMEGVGGERSASPRNGRGIPPIPPPIWRGISTLFAMSLMASRFTGVPSLAPSRSTIWILGAPSSAHPRATCTGSCEYTVSLAKFPWYNRTTLPCLKSMAGITSIMWCPVSEPSGVQSSRRVSAPVGRSSRGGIGWQ